MFWKRICHIAVLCLVALGVAAGEPEVRYFEAWGDVNGVAEGRQPLTEEQARKRYHSYRITSLDGKVQELAKVHWAQYQAYQLTCGFEAPIIRFVYDQTGALDYADMLAEDGTNLIRIDYEPGARFADLKRVAADGQTRRAGLASIVSDQSIGLFNFQAKEPFGYGTICRLEYIRSASGETREIRFYDKSKNVTTDADGIAGIRYEPLPDDRGNRMTLLGTDGKPRNNRYGMAQCVITHDAHKRPFEATMLDLAGHPAVSSSGYHKHRLLYDENGNISEYFYFDQNGNPTAQKNGFYGGRYQIDPSKHSSTTIFLNRDGKPMAHPQHKFSAMTRSINGNVRRESYLDENMNPKMIAHGYSSVIITNDEKNRRVLLQYWDKNDQPLVSDQWAAATQLDYDREGSKQTYLDRDGKPVAINGVMFTLAPKNKWGESESISYLDHAGNMVANQYGNAKFKYLYDRVGNFVGAVFYQADGKPDSRLKIERDKHGQETGRVWFDKDGNRL